MTTTPTQGEQSGQGDELEQSLANGLRHTLKLVPQSQRELFVFELAKYIQANYTPKVQSDPLQQLRKPKGPGHVEPAVQGDDCLDGALGLIRAETQYEPLIEPTRGRKWGNQEHTVINPDSLAAAKAAIQAQLDAAYQRGRIDEAKTCEEAKRHG